MSPKVRALESPGAYLSGHCIFAMTDSAGKSFYNGSVKPPEVGYKMGRTGSEWKIKMRMHK